MLNPGKVWAALFFLDSSKMEGVRKMLVVCSAYFWGETTKQKQRTEISHFVPRLRDTTLYSISFPIGSSFWLFIFGEAFQRVIIRSDVIIGKFADLLK